MSSMDSYGEPQRKVRPTALTVICVLAIVFGALGLLAGCFALISQLLSSAIQQAITAGQAGANGAAAAAQAEMVSRTMAIAAKYSPILVPLTILKIAVEGAVLIGGILAIRLSANGRSLLAGALLAALILESIQFVPTYIVQRDTRNAMAELMPQIMAAQGANTAPAGFDMGAMTSGMGTVTLVFSLFWLLIKIVLYILGIRYLKSSNVVALYPAAAS